MKKKIFIITLVLVLLAVFSYLFFYKKSSFKNIFSDTATTTSTTISGTREYRNGVRNFSLFYPEDLTYKEYQEGELAYTIVFEDKTKEKNFQIFFTPYLGETITNERLLKDVPSGDYTELVEVVLDDGTHAIVFFSNGPLGKLREVWFIKDGFLYEVTTYEHLDVWLSDIMKSWKFL